MFRVERILSILKIIREFKTHKRGFLKLITSLNDPQHMIENDSELEIIVTRRTKRNARS